jgi:S1-C subfamily serine protease
MHLSQDNLDTGKVSMIKDKCVTPILSLATILVPLVVACGAVITPTPPAQSSPEPTATFTPIMSSAPYAPTTPGVALNLPDIASVVELVRPSVVSVVAEVFLGTDVFGRPATDFASGTGVIFDPAGYILTNNHVIQGAIDGAIEITTDNGDVLSARLIGGDALVDLAVLKIDTDGIYRAASLGSSSEMRVGEWVIAIGNALALPGGPTVTVGVVSALGRSLPVNSQVTLFDLIQTDAPINPGNSGGPLVNLRGEVVGINTAATRGRQGEAEGLGFSIGMDTAIPVARQLMSEGRVRWAFLGLRLSDLDPESAARADIPVRQGVVVLVDSDLLGVDPDGPGGRGGVRAGDIIISMDGKPTPTLYELIRVLRFELTVGQTVVVRVFRDGAELDLTVTLGERPQ